MPSSTEIAAAIANALPQHPRLIARLDADNHAALSAQLDFIAAATRVIVVSSQRHRHRDVTSVLDGLTVGRDERGCSPPSRSHSDVLAGADALSRRLQGAANDEAGRL
jgi:hypothetical protein